MNTRTIVASLLSGLVLVSTSLTLGGVEPSPFHQLINELDSVENVLDTVDDQLKEILHPPDPVGKLVGKLNAMADKLVRQNGRVEDVIEAFDTLPPDPCHEEEFIAALGKVGSKASSIAERAFPPDPCAPEVEEALEAVKSAALGIVETVYGSMPSIS
jgi:hypothetical protein